MPTRALAPSVLLILLASGLPAGCAGQQSQPPGERPSIRAAPSADKAPDLLLPVQLPRVDGRTAAIEAGPAVWVSMDRLGASCAAPPATSPRGEPPAPREDLHRLSAGLTQIDAFELPELGAYLESCRRWLEAREGSEARLNLYLDQRVPFATLAQVVYTAARRGFRACRLAVRSEASAVRAVAIDMPRAGGPAALLPLPREAWRSLRADLTLAWFDDGLQATADARPSASAGQPSLGVISPGLELPTHVVVTPAGGQCPLAPRSRSGELDWTRLAPFVERLCAINAGPYGTLLMPAGHTPASELAAVLAAATPAERCRGPVGLAVAVDMPSGVRVELGPARCQGKIDLDELQARMQAASRRAAEPPPEGESALGALGPSLSGMGGIGSAGGLGLRDGAKGGLPTRIEAKGRAGSLSREAILKTIKAHLEAIRACYEKGLTRDAELEGKVLTKILVQPDGRVSSCRVEQSTLGDEEVGACIVKEIETWRFPAAARPSVIHYPFVFKHAG
ncbi:MAG: energy transducer TonB [Deltaproteobacteria bacterium]|nr:energy transducer TonB [Deltaproteobacteria bacterium]